MDGVEFVPSARINDLHRQAILWRDKAVADAGQACRCAIECGQLLSKSKEQCRHGDWLLWLESFCPEITAQTARNYMRVAERYSKALLDGSVDFQTLKDLYIATGIMPEPSSAEHATNSQPLPVWARLTTKIDGLIEKLKPDEKDSLRNWCKLVLERL
jgi:hypothetical protein